MEDGLKVGKGRGLGSGRRQDCKGSRHWASDEADEQSSDKETKTGRLMNKIVRLRADCVRVRKHEALDWTAMRILSAVPAQLAQLNPPINASHDIT